MTKTLKPKRLPMLICCYLFFNAFFVGRNQGSFLQTKRIFKCLLTLEETTQHVIHVTQHVTYITSFLTVLSSEMGHVTNITLFFF